MKPIRPGQTYRAVKGRYMGKMFSVVEVVKRENSEVWVRLARGGRQLDVIASEILKGKDWEKADLERIMR